MRTFFLIKNEAKVKIEDEKNQLLIQARYEFHFYIVGKLKDRRAKQNILCSFFRQSKDGKSLALMIQYWGYSMQFFRN